MGGKAAGSQPKPAGDPVTKKKPGRKKASEPLPKPEEMTDSQKRTEQERLERLSRPFWIPTDKSGNDYRWQFLSDEAIWMIARLSERFGYELTSVGETVAFTMMEIHQVRDMLTHLVRWEAISRAGNLYRLKPEFVRMCRQKFEERIKKESEG